MVDMNQLLIAGSNVDISNAIHDPTSNGNVTGSVGANGHDDNHGNPVTGIAPVTNVAGNNNGGMNLSTSHSQDDSLALSLNLALASDQLSKAPIHTNSHENGGTGTAVNTGSNSNATTSMPTPINISQGSNSIDGSNPGTNKSSGLSGLRMNIHTLTSNASSPVVSNGLSTNTVRMFQRMDEMSARLIAMEEMFQKLCKTIDHQSTTISDLRQENSKFSAELSKKLDDLSQNGEQAKDTTDQDSFVTDLLNSITNVSSTYLRKIRSRTDTTRKFKSTDSLSELNQHFLPQYHQQHNTQTQQQINHNSSSTTLQDFGVRRSSSSTFTLNPEGIKRRKKNDLADTNITQNQSQNQNGGQVNGHNNNNNVNGNTHINSSVTHSGFHSNVASGSQSYTDLNSLNAFGTISLPNLTLENTGITPLLKYGSNGMHFPRLHDNLTPSTSNGNNNNILQQTQSLNPDQHKAQLSRMAKNSKNAGFAAELDEPADPGIVAQPGQHPDQNANEEEDDDDEDDDGYQEDDDDDNEDDDEEEDDEEDDEEDEEDAEDKEEAGSQRVGNGNQKSSKKRKTKGASLGEPQVSQKDVTKGAKNKAISAVAGQNNGSGGPNSRANSAINNHAANKPRDMNYTLLKAPSNVKTIWEEYSHGIDGNPSIKGLEEKYGNKWRLNRNRKTFARRKRLYKFILNGINKGKTPDEMINILEERRLYKDENGEVKRRTIGWLQQSLTGI